MPSTNPQRACVGPPALAGLLLMCSTGLAETPAQVPPAEGAPADQEASTVEEAPAAPAVVPAPFPVIEVTPRNVEHWDATVFAEPSAMSPMAGHVARGARIPLLGQVEVPRARYCKGDLFYAVSPAGFLCADDAVPLDAMPSNDKVLQLLEDIPLPYRYAMVKVEEGQEIPMWASLSDIADLAPPKRMLGRGDTIALSEQTVSVEGQLYRVSIDGDVVAVEHTHKMRKFSEWQGTSIEATTHLPFAWVTRRKVRIYDAPKGKKVGELARRTRVDILGEEQLGRRRWLRIGDGQYVRDRDVNEVRAITRPEGTGDNPQWIDLDLGEQVVVAYRGNRPVYATLTSSGRPPHNTPRGNYPIWGKASAITMKSQPYDDKPYYVHRVPWVLFFQAHNALHGAYWHDRFGLKKSHGCANLSPKDARFLFEWVEPKLQPGWTALRFTDAASAPTVHVRNTAYRHAFRQERPPGPPDPAEEAKRLERAEERRRLEQEALQAQEPQPGVVSGMPPSAPGAAGSTAAAVAPGMAPPTGAATLPPSLPEPKTSITPSGAPQ